MTVLTNHNLHIGRDCLGNRQRRIDYDLVQDQAEKELLKEIELISQVLLTSDWSAAFILIGHRFSPP